MGDAVVSRRGRSGRFAPEERKNVVVRWRLAFETELGCRSARGKIARAFLFLSLGVAASRKCGRCDTRGGETTIIRCPVLAK